MRAYVHVEPRVRAQGFPGRAAPSQQNQRIRVTWDTGSFHTIIRLFAVNSRSSRQTVGTALGAAA